jgi:hypothetical protein
MSGFLHRLRLRSERGLALPLTVLAMAVTGAVAVTAIEYSSSSGRTSEVGKARVSARAAAEAGINYALSILNNALDPKQGTLLPTSPPTVLSVGNGTATFSGVYNSTTFQWTITSIGSVPNPTGGPAITQTLTRIAQVNGLTSGASVGAWSRMFHDNTSVCMTLTDVTIPTPVASRGDLCLEGSAKITGSTTTVEVGDDVRMTGTGYLVDRPAGAGGTNGTGTAWSTPGNVVSSNNVRATVTLAGNAQTQNLDATGFGFSIPAGSTIDGIRVEIERNASGSSIDDEDVYILKSGAATGTDHASSTDWPTSDGTRTYGGSTDPGARPGRWRRSTPPTSAYALRPTATRARAGRSASTTSRSGSTTRRRRTRASVRRRRASTRLRSRAPAPTARRRPTPPAARPTRSTPGTSTRAHRV